MLLVSAMLGVISYELTRFRLGRWAIAVAAGAFLVFWLPAIVAAGVIVAAAVVAKQRLARRRAGRQAADRDVLLLAELVQLGLAAGLTFAAALDTAADEVAPLLRDEVRRALRKANAGGLAPALMGDGGRAAALFAIAAQASVTGAPLLPAVDALVQQQLQEERSRHQAAARRLPVRLLIPVALLILPGFVVLTVAPALLGAFERLQF